MKQIWIKDTIKMAEQVIDLYGWISNRRDHGKIIFIDLRDRSGMVQVVCGPWAGDELYGIAQKLRNEWVVKITGLVKTRPESAINKDLITGTVEIDAQKIEVLNESQTPAFDVEGDGKEIGEELRMKYRYLDLRRPRMQKNIETRYNFVRFIRDYLHKEDFYEIETPIITKSTPEGARDYVVPSRLYEGKFFALPQSPQQYKQLLMASGMEKYFQIARCFRDEDTRGDRQPEFTQLDLEMSFVERDDVIDLNEKMIIELIKTVAPEKRIQQIPFPRLTYKEAMEKYGNDRPDIREDKNDPNLLAFCWVIDFPFFQKTENGGWTFTHNPFSSPKPEFMDDLMNKRNIENIITSQYDIVLNGFEVGGGSIRNHQAQALKKVFEIMGFSEERIIKNFEHMLEAFSYGTPPHGGIAWGIDRWVTLLRNEPNIREVIAFPKTGDARDLMMDAPSDLEEKQLKELHISIIKKEIKK